MKKIISFIFAFVLLIVMPAGCKKEETTENITLENLIDKMDKKQDIILLLVKDECENCSVYKEMMKYYAKEENEIIYYLSVKEEMLQKEKFIEIRQDIINSISYTQEELVYPSTVLIKDGKVINAIDDNINDLQLETFFNCYFKLTMEQLEEKLSSQEDFVFVVKSRYCGHCSAFEPIVKKYSKKNKKIIYYLDVADSQDTSLTDDKRQALKSKIYAVNTEYKKLYTPVTVKYESGKIKEAMIGYVEYEVLQEFLK